MFRAIRAVTSLATDLERQMASTPALQGMQRPVSDPHLALMTLPRSLSIGSQIRYGIVIDYVPYARFYRVMVENGKPLLPCTAAMQGAAAPFGVADCRTLQPYTPVFIVQHPESIEGHIIATLPPFWSDARLPRSDVIVQGGNSGLHADIAHSAPLRMPGGGGVGDRSCRMPTDAIERSDFTFCSSTGMMIHLDDYMAQFRVDEASGLFLFYWDQLVRLAGYNFQRWTSSTELESLDDEGEHMWYFGDTPYPWEHQGWLDPSAMSARELTAAGALETPYYSRREPQHDSLQPFHRVQRYGGYLGQAGKKLVIAPPEADSASNAPYLYREEPELVGVFDGICTLAGRNYQRTATGMCFTKRGAIPIPKRVQRPEEPAGDSAADYRGAGFHATNGQNPGAEHKLQSGMRPAVTHPSMAAAAANQDYMAYAFNWEGLHPFHYHEKDFALPEESNVPQIQTNQYSPSFSQLLTKPFLDPPVPTEVHVDHRHTAMIYPNNSYITLLDDGGVVIGDGYGAEMRMTGGNIHLACPGDVYLESGKNVNIWAGRDIIGRAKQSVDFTATDRDVRLKGKSNVQIVADTGGLFLESRSYGADYNFDYPGHASMHVGIILKAPNSPIVNWGNNIYLRTGGGSGAGAVGQGAITLDASRGAENIITNCRVMENFLTEAMKNYFNVGGDGFVDRCHSWTPSESHVSGKLCIHGMIVNDGDHLLRGNVRAANGGFFSNNHVPFVELLAGASLQQTLAEVQTCIQDIMRFDRQGRQEYRTDLKTTWYEQGKAGNDTVMGAGMTSLRTVQDYKTDNWAIFESRWAQMARLGGGGGSTWTESSLSFNGQATYPYPGKENFDNPTLWRLDPLLYDMSAGVSKNRGALYENSPKINEPTPSSLHGYTIIG